MRRLFGIRDIIIAHFDQRMMHMDWREFVGQYLVAEHGAVHLVAGHDFHFGYKGEGNPRPAAGGVPPAGHRMRHHSQGSPGRNHRLVHLHPLPHRAGGDGAGQRIPGPPLYPEQYGGPRQKAGQHAGLPHGQSGLPARRDDAGVRRLRHKGLF